MSRSPRTSHVTSTFADVTVGPDIGRDIGEITCSVNVRVDPDTGLESVIAAVTAYRDAGVDLIIVNLPHHVRPDSLKPLAEVLAPLA